MHTTQHKKTNAHISCCIICTAVTEVEDNIALDLLEIVKHSRCSSQHVLLDASRQLSVGCRSSSQVVGAAVQS